MRLAWRGGKKKWDNLYSSVISGFRWEVDEYCALRGYYTASSGNFLAMFRDNLSVPSSGVKNPEGFLTSESYDIVGGL